MDPVLGGVIAMAENPMTVARTRRLATRCFVCNTELCDALSVELGIGPTCRKRLGLGTKGPGRAEVNELTARCALLAEDGEILEVIDLADQIATLGYPKVAEAVRKRFVDIRIAEVDGMLHVKTPYSDLWNQINRDWRLGRWNPDLKVRMVDPKRKSELYRALRVTYPGRQAMAPDGAVFTIVPVDQRVIEQPVAA